MMRARARRPAKYFIDKNSDLAGLSREELEKELQNKDDLLPKIVRMGCSLSGTRPFWKSVSKPRLDSLIHHPCS
jgi:hypothetical protein